MVYIPKHTKSRYSQVENIEKTSQKILLPINIKLLNRNNYLK